MAKTAASLVRAFLEREKISARALAEKVGTHEAQISRVLTGRNAFSKALAVRVHRLDPKRLPLDVLAGLK